MRILKNNLVFVKNCSKGPGERFGEAPKVGETIQIRLPARYTVRTGDTRSAQDHTEKKVDMTVQPTTGIDVDFTSRELTFNLDNFSERVLAPQIATLANEIDRQAYMLAYKATYNSVGTPGSLPTTIKLYNQGRAKMVNAGTPQDRPHSAILNPDMHVEIADALKALMHPDEEIKKAFATGRLGRALGANWYESANVPVHTYGTQGGTPTVNGASQVGSSIVTQAWTASAAQRLNKGDVINFAGVYAVNPQTRQSTGKLQDFVVLADASSNGSGALTVTVSPEIIVSGAFQTVTNSPANGAAITVSGASAVQSPQGLRWHRDAFQFASMPLIQPNGMDMAKVVTDPDTGISLSFVRGFNISTRKFESRFDVVWAFAAAYPELAVRYQG